MGIIGAVLQALFGNGRNVLRETVEVFSENSEAGAARAATFQTAALAQLSAEFSATRRGRFDLFMDALNRVPRPAMVLGTFGLFLSAMFDPIWFATRMQGLALVPDPLWWLMGAIVSFYFGARSQTTRQEFEQSIARTMARVPEVIENTQQLRNLDEEGQGIEEAENPTEHTLNNPALSEWRSTRSNTAGTGA